MNENLRPVDGAKQGWVATVALVLSVPFGALDALIARDLYSWFVQPITHLPVTFLQAWGFLICLAMLRLTSYRVRSKNDQVLATDLLGARIAMVGVALGLWGIGALIARGV